MALKRCVECGKQVSSKATNCQSCGAPVAKPKLFGCSPILLLLLVGSIALVAYVKAPLNTNDNKVTLRDLNSVPALAVKPPSPPPEESPAVKPPSPPPEDSHVLPKHVAVTAMEARKKEKQFREVIEAVGFDGVIAKLISEPNGPPWLLTITVNKKWDTLPRQTRFEYAKTFRGAWVGAVPPEPGGARVIITIKNKAGETVGRASKLSEPIQLK
jgi:hypothetical protein